MENFNFDGTYPGYVDGDWLVDERDGHVWLNMPNVSLLESFPNSFTLHFMETPKAYGDSNLNLSDEVFSIDDFTFDTILQRNEPKVDVRDYYEVIVGKIVDVTIPNHIPKGITIGSIVIKSTLTNKPVNIINLRNVLSLDILRDVKLHFGIAVRTAPYGLTKFENVNLGNGRTISTDTFFIEAPITDFQNKVVKYSSPEDYIKFLESLANSEDWFKRYGEIDIYDSSSLRGPTFKLKPGPEGLTIVNLEGIFEIIRGFTGIQSIQIPFCPGISVVMRITEFNDKGTKTPFLNFTDGRFVSFNIVTRFIEVSR